MVVVETSMYDSKAVTITRSSPRHLPGHFPGNHHLRPNLSFNVFGCFVTIFKINSFHIYQELVYALYSTRYTVHTQYIVHCFKPYTSQTTTLILCNILCSLLLGI